MEDTGKDRRRTSVIYAQASAPAVHARGMVVKNGKVLQTGTPVEGKNAGSAPVQMGRSIRPSATDPQVNQLGRPVDPRGVNHVISIVIGPVMGPDVSA